MFAVSLTVIVCLGLVAGYVFFVRPMIRQWASLKDFWASTDAFELGLWGKTKALFDGIKIKLLARLVWVPSLFVGVYDKFTELCASCDLSPLTSHLPSAIQGYMPLLASVAVPILIDWARSYSSQPAA